MGHVFLSIHSVILCLLIGAFNPFMFNVIIDGYLFIAIFSYLCSSVFHYFSSCSESKPFSISCSAGLVEMYSFNPLLSGKLLISHSILIESLAGKSSIGCRPLVLITRYIYCHSLLAWSISIEKSVANLIGAPLYVTSCFSFVAFKILSLSLTFGTLIMVCHGSGTL